MVNGQDTCVGPTTKKEPSRLAVEPAELSPGDVIQIDRGVATGREPTGALIFCRVLSHTRGGQLMILPIAPTAATLWVWPKQVNGIFAKAQSVCAAESVG